MTQLSLGYSEAERGRMVWKDALEWARALVDQLGNKVVAAELDVSPSWLADALKEREHGEGKKGLKAEHFHALLFMAPIGMRMEWLRMVCQPLGFETPAQRKVRTPEEQLADLKQLLEARLGDVGRQLLKEVGS
jgi:hypothetical protein